MARNGYGKKKAEVVEVVGRGEMIGGARDKVSVAEMKAEEERDVDLKLSGLTRRKLFQVVSEGLEATVAIFNQAGQKVGEAPAHSIRAKFAPLATEILGEKAKGEQGQRFPNIVIITADGRKL